MELIAVPVAIITGGIIGFWGGVVVGLVAADHFQTDELEGAMFGALAGIAIGAVALGTIAAAVT